MNYLLAMRTINWKQVLWQNVKARMTALYGKENLSRLIKDAGVGPGTVTRIKEQETSVGVDVLEKIAMALKIEPWQLIHPTLGEVNESKYHLAPVNTAQGAMNNVATLEQITEALAGYLIQMDDDGRDDAGDLLRKLAHKPEGHARTAVMLQAAFQSGKRKAA